MNEDKIIDVCAWAFVIIIVGGFVLGLGYISEYFPCKAKAEAQGLEYSYGFFQGCMVKQENGKWIDYDRLRIMEK